MQGIQRLPMLLFVIIFYWPFRFRVERCLLCHSRRTLLSLCNRCLQSPLESAHQSTLAAPHAAGPDGLHATHAAARSRRPGRGGRGVDRVPHPSDWPPPLSPSHLCSVPMSQSDHFSIEHHHMHRQGRRVTNEEAERGRGKDKKRARARER